MPRLLWSLLVGASVVFVAAEAGAAPAPFPKTDTTTGPLFSRLRGTVIACGYQLHGVRPAPKKGEYVLVISCKAMAEHDRMKQGLITTSAVSVERLLDQGYLAFILELAYLNSDEGKGLFPKASATRAGHCK